MGYQDFCIKFEPPEGEEYPVAVIESPAGGGSGRFRLPIAPTVLRKLGGWAYRSVVTGADEAEGQGEALAGLRELERSSGIPADPARIGEVLFQSLFSGRIRDLLERSFGKVEDDPDSVLRLRLIFDLEIPALREIASLPWELLFRQERREFLILSRKSPVARSLLVPRPVRPVLEPPLRILVAASNLLDNPLDLESEVKALQEVAGTAVELLQPPTPAALRAQLLDGGFHVLHFLGHGQFDAATGQGALLFQDDSGKALPLSGRALADLVRDFPSVRLAFLNACHSARAAAGTESDPFLGTAAALALAGLPAVVAMQAPISDDAAKTFSRRVYERLAAGDPIDTAVAEGRVVLGPAANAAARPAEWATPVLFLRSAESRLFDGPGDPFGSRDADLRRQMVDRQRLIEEKTQGFVGRRWVFQALDELTRDLDRGYFVVRGDPGIGKSALIAQLTKRTGVAHHFNVRADGLNRPEHFLANVCAQLLATYRLGGSSLPPEATRDGRFLGSLLEKVSERLRAGEHALLLVDALDEADSSGLGAGVNPLYLPPFLPPRIYVVVTTRRGGPYFRYEGEQRRPVDLLQDSPENLADIREYLENALLRPGIRRYVAGQGLDDSAFISKLADKSQGNFMYLRYVLPEVERGADQDLDFSELPEGLEGYYQKQWERMQFADPENWQRVQLPVLAALTVVREPISFEKILKYSRVEHPQQVQAALNRWEPFLYSSVHETGAGGVKEKRYRFYHESFREFIAEKEEVVRARILEDASSWIGSSIWKKIYGGG